jgi:hypothetical protein
MVPGTGERDGTPEIPEFMALIVDRDAPASPRAAAERNVLALDAAMQAIYADALAGYKAHLRRRHPIVLALFSGAGGRLLLYPPGEDLRAAPDPPLVYQLAKAVAHSAMASFQLTAPYLRDAASDPSWRGPVRVYRDQVGAALEALPDLDVDPADRGGFADLLEHNLAYLDRALAAGGFAYADLERFARGQTPLLRRAIAVAARAQVGHWTAVFEGWKRELGADWGETYAATNTLHMTRTNNTLFELLAQQMGERAINDRLFLFETLDYTTDPEKMLDLLARVVADRALGRVFFKDYYLMDVELFTSAVRAEIEARAAREGRPALLPSLAPFHGHAWPWTTDPASGTGPATLEEAAGSRWRRPPAGEGKACTLEPPHDAGK